jgi:hypothetical protein
MTFSVIIVTGEEDEPFRRPSTSITEATSRSRRDRLSPAVGTSESNHLSSVIKTGRSCIGAAPAASGSRTDE